MVYFALLPTQCKTIVLCEPPIALIQHGRMRSKSSNFSTVFVKILQRHRLKKKLSRQGLAERAGLHQTAVGLIERGLRTPSVDSAFALANAMNLPLSGLVQEAERKMKNGGSARRLRAAGSSSKLAMKPD